MLKTAAIIVTVIGLLTALELSIITSKHKSVTPLQTPHLFSNILGFYPAIIHRIPPTLLLAIGQKIATQTLDMI